MRTTRRQVDHFSRPLNATHDTSWKTTFNPVCPCEDIALRGSQQLHQVPLPTRHEPELTTVLQVRPRSPGTGTQISIPLAEGQPTLLIRKAHRILLHAGPQATLYELRQQHSILDGPRSVQRLIRQCTTCRRFMAKAEAPWMANLPQNG